MPDCLYSLPVPLLLGGATATGKSDVAVALALAVDGEIVNGDPFQMWAGVPILTAQPAPEQSRRVPHHLYGFARPGEERNAAGFAGIVREKCERIAATGRLPIVVSGSGLYLRAIAGGLDMDIPASDPEVRAGLESRSLADLVDELTRLDPEEAARIDLRNPRRVVRALEICLVSGKRASTLRKRQHDSLKPSPAGVWLDVGRDMLRDRIARRCQWMFEAGVLTEVEQLDCVGAGEAVDRTLGLREVRACLRGEATRAEATAALTSATWRLAKRQRTWFRKANDLIALPYVPDAENAVRQAAEAILRLFRFS